MLPIEMLSTLIYLIVYSTISSSPISTQQQNGTHRKFRSAQQNIPDEVSGVYAYFSDYNVYLGNESYLVSRSVIPYQIINFTNWLVLEMPPKEQQCTVLLCIHGTWTVLADYGTRLSLPDRDLVYYCNLDLKTLFFSRSNKFSCQTSTKNYAIMQLWGTLSDRDGGFSWISVGNKTGNPGVISANTSGQPLTVVMYNPSITVEVPSSFPEQILQSGILPGYVWALVGVVIGAAYGATLFVLVPNYATSLAVNPLRSE